jgi:hypothetical protein
MMNPEPHSPEDVPQSTHLSPKAVELFLRALEIEAAGATGKWEPEGRRLEYIDIAIALMRELGQGFWGVSVLDVHENAEGPPAWERNPRNIESWHEAIRLRRALVDAVTYSYWSVSAKFHGTPGLGDWCWWAVSLRL